MKRTMTLLSHGAFFALLCGVMAVPSYAIPVASDVVTIGTVNATGLSVDVPVYIRDTSGTPLGIDQPAGSKIQSWSIKVTYAPAAAVSSVSFTRAGITTALTPAFESSPSGVGTVTLLDTFDETTNPVPFTLDAAAPGDEVAHLSFTLAPPFGPKTITLTLDPSLTELTDQGGDASTTENASNGKLTLVNGAIEIQAIPTLSPWVLFMLAATLALAGWQMRG